MNELPELFKEIINHDKSDDRLKPVVDINKFKDWKKAAH